MRQELGRPNLPLPFLREHASASCVQGSRAIHLVFPLHPHCPGIPPFPKPATGKSCRTQKPTTLTMRMPTPECPVVMVAADKQVHTGGSAHIPGCQVAVHYCWAPGRNAAEPTPRNKEAPSHPVKNIYTVEAHKPSSQAVGLNIHNLTT